MPPGILLAEGENWCLLQKLVFLWKQGSIYSNLLRNVCTLDTSWKNLSNILISSLLTSVWLVICHSNMNFLLYLIIHQSSKSLRTMNWNKEITLDFLFHSTWIKDYFSTCKVFRFCTVFFLAKVRIQGK